MSSVIKNIDEETDAFPELIIRVMSGLNVGAEVILPNYDLLLGSSSKADIILYDSMVDGLHARLTWKNASLQFEPIGRTVYLNGQILTEATDVALYDVLSLGGTSICIGEAGKEWPEVDVQKTMQDGKALTSKLNMPMLKLLYNRWPIKHISFPLQGFIGFIFLTFSFYLFSSDDETVTPDVLRISQVIQGLGWNEKIEAVDENGKIVIKGYLSTKENKQSLFNVLDALQIPVENNIYIGTEVVAQVKGVLSSLGEDSVQVKVKKNFLGDVYLEGVIENDEAIDQITLTIKEDIPSVANVNTSSIITFEQAAQAFKTILKERFIEDQLKVEVKGDRINIRGNLLKTEEKRLEQAIAQYQDVFGGYPSISTELGSKIKNIINIDIQSVLVGDKISWLITKEGKRFSEGSKVGEYTLQQIKPDHLIFINKDGEEIEIRL